MLKGHKFHANTRWREFTIIKQRHRLFNNSRRRLATREYYCTLFDTGREGGRRRDGKLSSSRLLLCIIGLDIVRCQSLLSRRRITQQWKAFNDDDNKFNNTTQTDGHRRHGSRKYNDARATVIARRHKRARGSTREIPSAAARRRV